MALKLLGSLESSGGNVGIGTTSPTYKLDVSGDFRVKDGSSAIAFNEYSNGATIWLDGSNGDFAGGDYFNISAYGTTDLAFGYAAGTKITMKSDGKLGIGTTSPSTALEVIGDIKIKQASTYSNYSLIDASEALLTLSTYTVNASSYPADIKFSPNQTERMRITDDGNVGIGTSAPLEKLHVVGKINSSNNIVSNATYTMFTGRSSRTVDDYGGLNKQYFKANLVTPGPDTTGESSAHGIADLRFQLANSAGNTGMSDIMTLRSGGNIGIGTTVPYSLLQVGNPEQTTPAELTIASRYDGGGPILNFRTDHPNNANQWNMARIQATDDGNYNGRLEFKTTVNSGHTGTQPQTRMVIKATGNVGIGTASPSDMLHIHATGNGYKALIVEDDARRIELGRDMITAKSADGSTVQNLYIQPAGNTAFATTSGNVGIGTASPSAKLHVHHTSEEVLRIDSGTTGAIHFFENTTRRGILGYSNGTSIATAADAGDMILRAESGSKLHLAIAGTSRLAVASDGDVGIGTAAPAQKLHVAGNQVRLDTAAGGYYLHNGSGGFRGAFHDNGTVTSIYADGNGSTPALSIESNNVTFAGEATFNASDGHINLDGNNAVIFDNSNNNNAWYIRNGGSNAATLQMGTGSSPGSNIKLTLDGSGNATFAADVTVGGNLIVNGTTTTLNTTTVEVEDNILQLNTTQGTPDTATAATSGISVYRGDGVTQASLIFDDGDDTWDLTNNLAVAGTVTTGGDLTIGGTGGVFIPEYIYHTGDTNTYLGFPSNNDTIVFATNGSTVLTLDASNAATFAGKIYTPDGSASAPSYSFSGRTDTGMYAAAHSTNDRIHFATDGAQRFYIDGNGTTSVGNSYVGENNSFRNYAGDWGGTTGTANKGFYFLNTASGNTTKAMQVTHDGNATFAGTIDSGAITSTGVIKSNRAEAQFELVSTHGRTSYINQGGGNLHIKAAHASGVGINYGDTTNPGLLKLYNNTTAKITLDATAGNATFAGTVTHNGIELTSGFAVDQIREFPMTFQLSANTWTDTGIDGTDLSTGTYAMQVYVSDFSVGGQHYYEYYSATISWYGGGTNSTVVDEIPVHRAGHAPNAGDLQFRTQRASGTDTHDLMLQVKTNSAYTGALDNSSGGKIMRFKFRRLM